MHSLFNSLLVTASVGIGATVWAGESSNQIYEQWKEAQIADAISAAPPSITAEATVYGWDDDGKMILLRHGTNTYNCVATGHLSRRVRLADPPFPDPACYDQHAWAFFQAMWREENPMKPERPYPTTPGLVWMLAGMGVPDGMVRHGATVEGQFKVNSQGKKVAKLSPHIMIMPLPVKGKQSDMPAYYDPDNPEGSWVMAAESVIEHVMVHFTEEDVRSMMSEGEPQ